MEKAKEDLEIIGQYFTDFTEEQLSQLRLLRSVYEEWNEKINVISRKDMDGLYLKHVLHSLSIATVIQFKPGARIIDIGTGGGFPGIPLAIFFPETSFHLVDSIGKKLKVVEAVVAATGLNNVTTQHTRAEAIKDRKFDFVVSRAVAPLAELWNWSKPLIQKSRHHDFANGLFCLKGGDLAQEISESNLRPTQIPISRIFSEDYFTEKYILYAPKI